MSPFTQHKKLIINEVCWKILSTAYNLKGDYFNIANLHYEWSGGKLSTASRQIWYQDIRILVKRLLLSGFNDEWSPSCSDPNLYEISRTTLSSVDFRKRMSFRITRRGIYFVKKELQCGHILARPSVSEGYWVEENKDSSEKRKVDLHGSELVRPQNTK